MLRGSVIIFTGILSIGFLNRKLGVREWIGIGFVITGLAFVGVSDILTMENSNISANSVITGDLLIIFAQVYLLLLIYICFTSIKFSNYNYDLIIFI